MKLFKPIKSRVLVLSTLCFSLFSVSSNAQLCSNAADSVYSLTTNGQFHSININNGGASAAILGGVAVNYALNSNGAGYSSVTGKFYFFNHCANGDSIEFVSYSPASGTKQVLAKPPAPMTIAAADKMRSGTVDNAGTGYYTILTTSPAAAATFYYYNIPTNSWKIIAQAFKDTASGASMDSMFHNLNSGDMTFDGSGNLWIICSKNPKYALYKVKAPVTTNTVPKLAVSVMIPTRNMPIASSVASITGVAFNSAGKLYFTTGSNSALASGVSTAGTNYNILYRMTSISPLVVDSIANLPNSYGDDLSSCFYPAGVLGNYFSDFTALLQNNTVKLCWKSQETEDVTNYAVEYSSDGDHWERLAYVMKSPNSYGESTYSYVHYRYITGRNYYRIVEQFSSDKKVTSETRLVDTRSIGKISIGPNPVNDVLFIYNKESTSPMLVRIYDNSGQVAYSTTLSGEQNSINVGRLSKGNFILRLSPTNAEGTGAVYHFAKW